MPIPTAPRRLVVLASSLLLALAAAAAPTAAGPQDLIARVRTLSAPGLAGRGAGTPEALAAAETVAVWFAAAGLRPAGVDGWFQPVGADSGEAAHDRNVIGIVPGAGALAGRAIVVGAHLDHLGRVDPAVGGLPGPGEFYPGADDNASGIAALVELAAGAGAPDGGASARRAVVFAAFAAEEIGLHGSRSFLAAPPVPRDSIDAMLNLDSIGRLGGGDLHVAGLGTSPVLAELVAAAPPPPGLSLRTSQGGWDAGDHVSFDLAGIPVLFLFTGAHEDYHRPTDEWTKVDPDGLARVTSFAAVLLDALRARPGRFPHLKVSGPPPAAPGGRRAWLGAIPDFTERARGIGVAGAMPGSPAAAAGLQAGDVLVSLDGRELRDLAHLAEVLRELAPGQTVEAVVERGGERLSVPVTLAERKGK